MSSYFFKEIIENLTSALEQPISLPAALQVYDEYTHYYAEACWSIYQSDLRPVVQILFTDVVVLQ
jgi:hypothetical protein